MMTDETWRKSQIEALIRCGMMPRVAERTVDETMRSMPPEADPRTWLPSENDLPDVLAGDYMQDAAADWYADDSVPNWARLLLDATTKPEQ